MPSKLAKAADETKEDTSANMSDTNTSDTTAVASPVPKAAKRDNEGNSKKSEDPTETTAKAPADEGPKPSPTSEIKKQNAAMSLTQLFTTTQDSLTSCESGTNDTLGEAGNFLAECFSGDGDGEHGHLAVDPNAAAVHAEEGESTTPTMENTTSMGEGEPSKKKAKGADGQAMPALPPIKTEGDEEPAATTTTAGKKQETPLALKAGAYRLNKLMEATKFTSPIPEHPPAQADAAEGEEIEVQEDPPQKVHVNRKEKSLALVCQNFMELCRDAPPCGDNDETGALVELNELAQHLGVKRRRIYDIINIMESVHIVSRLKKNTYRWHGTEKLPLTFARLQRDGLAELRSGLHPDKQVKGMTLTAQKLIQYFLTTGLMEIRLTDAAEAVLGPSEEKTFKTKIRRMYDIANVLTALGIVRKENVAGNTAKAQPSFKWVFPILPQDMAAHLPPEEQTGPVELIPPQPRAIAPMPSLDHEVEESYEVKEEEAPPEVEVAEQEPQEESEPSEDVDVKPEESLQELVSV